MPAESFIKGPLRGLPAKGLPVSTMPPYQKMQHRSRRASQPPRAHFFFFAVWGALAGASPGHPRTCVFSYLQFGEPLLVSQKGYWGAPQSTGLKNIGVHTVRVSQCLGFNWRRRCRFFKYVVVVFKSSNSHACTK